MPPINKISDLIRYGSRPAKVINLITMYRIVMVPVLFYFLFINRIDIFKWLLLASLFTDLIDGELARRYKVTSLLGARLDSIGDDLTILTGLVGVFYYRFEIMMQLLPVIIALLALYLLQLIYSIFKYGKMTTFHTILAKLSALFQSMFICSAFFFKDFSYFLFYNGIVFTALDIIEEITLVIMLRKWEANVKGIYWVLRRRRNNQVHNKTKIS